MNDSITRFDVAQKIVIRKFKNINSRNGYLFNTTLHTYMLFIIIMKSFMNILHSDDNQDGYECIPCRTLQYRDK